MKRHSTFLKIKDVSKLFWEDCILCGIETLHKNLYKIVVSGDLDGDSDFREEYSIIQCNGCHNVSFCLEDFYLIMTKENEVEEENIKKLFPERMFDRPIMKEIYSLPMHIQEIYRETLASLYNGLTILTGIGLRVLIEAICKDQNAEGKDLKGKIDCMMNRGFITKENAKILHNLRFMGNGSAHEVKSHSLSVLKIAFDIIEHTLKEVYILPQIHEKLRS